MTSYPWNSETEFLVIVNYYDYDVSWAERLKFPHVIYYKDHPDKEPFSAANKAKSETNLLKFISDFYDQLPRNVIIVHQYEFKGSHEGSLVDILNDPEFKSKYEASLTPGFWSFNKYVMPGISNELPTIKKSGWWEECMQPYFGNIEGYGNYAADNKGAAQFVVSRDRIRSLPVEFYRNMYDWLVTKTLDEPNTGINPNSKGRVLTPNFQDPHSNFFTSRYMEWSWELIFTAHQFSRNITQEINGIKISALYGAGSYYRDVTSQVIKHYLKADGSLLIDKRRLNDLFGDPISGLIKGLIIRKNNLAIYVNEDREFKIMENS